MNLKAFFKNTRAVAATMLIALFITGAVFLAPLASAAATSSRGVHLKMVTSTEAFTNKTASFNTAAVDVEDMGVLFMMIKANEDSGTATVDVDIETSPDGTNWVSTGTSFTQITATGNSSKSITTGAFMRYVRGAVTIGGSGQYDLTFYYSAKPHP